MWNFKLILRRLERQSAEGGMRYSYFYDYSHFADEETNVQKVVFAIDFKYPSWTSESESRSVVFHSL